MPSTTNQTRPPVQIRYLRDARDIYTPDTMAAETSEKTGTPESVKPALRYATPGSVGLDLRVCCAPTDAPTGAIEEMTIPAGGRLSVPTGIAVEPLTPGIAGFVYSRSGLGAVQGLTVAQGVGVIDPDYRGEIGVVLLNTSGESRRLRRGDRIAQLVFQPAFQVELLEVAELGTTDRGAGGFGHTGK